MRNGADLSRVIRLLREHVGLTQERFALQLDVTFATVNRWENGRSTPSRLARKQILAHIESLGPEGKDILRLFNEVCPK
jgi:DNA-binding transcriptional regulator YiaG